MPRCRDDTRGTRLRCSGACKSGSSAPDAARFTRCFLRALLAPSARCCAFTPFDTSRRRPDIPPEILREGLRYAAHAQRCAPPPCHDVFFFRYYAIFARPLPLCRPPSSSPMLPPDDSRRLMLPARAAARRAIAAPRLRDIQPIRRLFFIDAAAFDDRLLRIYISRCCDIIVISRFLRLFSHAVSFQMPSFLQSFFSSLQFLFSLFRFHFFFSSHAWLSFIFHFFDFDIRYSSFSLLSHAFTDIFFQASLFVFGFTFQFRYCEDFATFMLFRCFQMFMRYTCHVAASRRAVYFSS